MADEDYSDACERQEVFGLAFIGNIPLITLLPGLSPAAVIALQDVARGGDTARVGRAGTAGVGTGSRRLSRSAAMDADHPRPGCH
ncbi:hypothetical protein [Streptomyces sp. NPDC048349]|uniref:hypothetical protein n=1 Tax=Streptomyces sp. NPDC048349 TaxID=3155486 RepID=UPI0034263451